MTEKKRLLVIGATGLLGRHVVQAAAEDYTVIPTSHGSAGTPAGVALDVANAAAVNRAFAEARSDLVMLLAAIPDIDLCERRPDYAFNINARGAENVAKACAETNSRLLFTSTAAVFDGKKHGYDEQDQVSPLSVYGETKVWAERALAAQATSTIILRIALILGYARRPQSNSLLDRAMDRWKAGKPVFFPTYESRNPIDAASLSRIMLRMLKEEVSGGIYHVGSSESISRYELGKLLAARAGISFDLVQPVTDPIPGRAPRGADHFLLTEKIQRTCHIQMPTIPEVIESCLA